MKNVKDKWYKGFINEAVPQIIKIFKPKNIIIFGSRVKNVADENSDIDVIIVSEAFKDLKFLERMPFVLKKVKFPKHVDYLCYTSKEMEYIRENSFIVMDALNEGIDILSK